MECLPRSHSVPWEASGSIHTWYLSVSLLYGSTQGDEELQVAEIALPLYSCPQNERGIQLKWFLLACLR